MQTTISNSVIRKLNPCYDPSNVGIPDGEELPIIEWVERYKNTVKSKSDIIWLLCNKLFMSDKDMRLFAVWCARKTLKSMKNVSSINFLACDIAEKFANGGASMAQLSDACSQSNRIVVRLLARTHASSAARSVVLFSYDYIYNRGFQFTQSFLNSQITQLLTYFK